MVTIENKSPRRTRSGELINAGSPDAGYRVTQYRRDYRLCYAAAFLLLLFAVAMNRLRPGLPGRRVEGRRRRSIVEQARAEANIVASYALMGF